MTSENETTKVILSGLDNNEIREFYNITKSNSPHPNEEEEKSNSPKLRDKLFDMITGNLSNVLNSGLNNMTRYLYEIIQPGDSAKLYSLYHSEKSSWFRTEINASTIFEHLKSKATDLNDSGVLYFDALQIKMIINVVNAYQSMRGMTTDQEGVPELINYLSNNEDTGISSTILSINADTLGNKSVQKKISKWQGRQNIFQNQGNNADFDVHDPIGIYYFWNCKAESSNFISKFWRNVIYKMNMLWLSSQPFGVSKRNFDICTPFKRYKNAFNNIVMYVQKAIALALFSLTHDEFKDLLSSQPASLCEHQDLPKVLVLNYCIIKIDFDDEELGEAIKELGMNFILDTLIEKSSFTYISFFKCKFILVPPLSSDRELVDYFELFNEFLIDMLCQHVSRDTQLHGKAIFTDCMIDEKVIDSQFAQNRAAHNE